MPDPSVPDPQSFLEQLTARRPEMLEDLDRLVSAESPSSDPAALLACRSVLEEIGTRLLGERPTVLPGSDGSDGSDGSGTADGSGSSDPTGTPGGLLWRLGPADRTPVLLVGHLDTVWALGTLDRRPFAIQDSRATGPGVFDMKAGLVQGLHALSQLRADTGAFPAVAFLVTTDEEVGSPLGGPVVTEWARASRAALVLEGAADGGALKHARKGWSFYDISVKGRAAHAGLDPHEGRN
ncbi:MAG TPA: M20/M25/M40 family metallo-hydrolase, partial [Streptomyces sp.]|nr:M20/M25/M40 family metallo-hydrolase [Streptomyces sp.]